MLRRRWVEVAWGAFAIVNLGAMIAFPRWETVPFHFVWVSLTLVFGYRVWGRRSTNILLAVVMVSTGTAIAWGVVRTGEQIDELTEVPLMAAMFLAMVWHARRRQVAVEDARRLAEGEHRMLERQRDFVRDASHELRTPITVARGHAELLRASAIDSQAISDADVVIDELSRLSRLSERLLILAAAEHAEFLDVGLVDVRGLVEETGYRWSAAADRAWRVDASVSGAIQGDGNRLRDAVDALVENAVNATGPGESIVISGTRRDGRFVLEVSDGGIGIDPEQLPSLFDRFTRVDAPRTRRAGGTGLGLSIVKAIAEAHGGTVEAESAPGRGATFRIVLPGLRPVPASSSPTSPVSVR
jgi:signal transduction histidine kinase